MNRRYCYYNRIRKSGHIGTFLAESLRSESWVCWEGLARIMPMGKLKGGEGGAERGGK